MMKIRRRKVVKRKQIKWMVVFAVAFALMLVLAGCGSGGGVVTGASGGETPSENDLNIVVEPDVEENGESGGEKMEPNNKDNPVIEITMKSGGKIAVELDPVAAPITTENFLKLVDEGFYDGLTFHRIILDFMIQGGDPLGTGTGGSDEEITGEFAKNGWENPISHKRGVISMARSNDFNSASSQFFITNADSVFLDGGYAAFGRVISGMDVVDEITAVPTDGNDRPLTPVIIQTIRRK